MRMPSLPATRRRRSCLAPVGKQGKNLVQLPDRALQFADGFTGQLVGVGEVVGVFERILLEPFEAVELELAFAHLGDLELAPAVVRRIGGAAAGVAQRIGAEALLEALEMLLGQGSVF